MVTKEKKMEVKDAMQRLQHLLVDHGCPNTLEAITNGVAMIEADHATSHRLDLGEQFRTIEGDEILGILGILDGFIDEAESRGCSAAAFRILLEAVSCAASRTLAEDETQTAATRMPLRLGSGLVQ